MIERARPTAYRWVVLTAAMLVNATIQTLWICYAPVSSVAQGYYGVSSLAVGVFAMLFMVLMVPLAIPSGWSIARWGLRWPVGLAALAVGLGGLARGAAGQHYALAIAATVLIAGAQPFLLNAWTTTAAAWFPDDQRATAVSLVTLANLVGTAAGLVLSPALAGGSDPSMTIGALQTWLGATALAAGVLYVVLVPSAHPAAGHGVTLDDAHATAGMRDALRLPAFQVLLLAVLFIMGVFNGVTTWVEEIVAPRGFASDEAGLVGVAMLGGGVVGAVGLSAWSDRVARRTPFLVGCTAVAIVGLLGVTFLRELPLLLAAAAVLGVGLTSCLPIGLQYGTEVLRSVPASTVNALLQLVAQCSVVLVLVLEVVAHDLGSMTSGLVGYALALGVVALMLSRLPDSVVRE